MGKSDRVLASGKEVQQATEGEEVTARGSDAFWSSVEVTEGFGSIYHFPKQRLSEIYEDGSIVVRDQYIARAHVTVNR
jgi:hypothetical protein